MVLGNKRRNGSSGGIPHARNILNKYLRDVNRDSEVLVGPLANPRAKSLKLPLLIFREVVDWSKIKPAEAV